MPFKPLQQGTEQAVSTTVAPASSGTKPSTGGFKPFTDTPTISATPEVASEPNYFPEPTPNFFQRVKDTIVKRGESYAESTGRMARGEQSMLETGLQGVSQGIGALGDITGDALITAGKKVLPDKLQKKMASDALKVLQSEEGRNALQALQGGIESYREWKTANPRTAANIEAVVNIGTFLPIGRAAKEGGNIAARTALEAAENTLPGIARGAEEGLRKSALSSIEKALGATTKALKQKGAKVAEGILDRPFLETFAPTRQGMLAKATSKKELAGEAIEELGTLTGKTETAVILDALEQEKNAFVAGNRIVNKKGYESVSKVQEIIANYGDEIDDETLREVRRIFDAEVKKSNKPFTMTGDESSVLEMKKVAANKIRGILAEAHPDMADLNKEFTFWSNLEEVLDTTVKRTAPQQGFASDLATMAGAASGNTTVDIMAKALTFRWLQQSFKSPAWRLTSARVKSQVADLISQKNFIGALQVLESAGTKEMNLPDSLLKSYEDLKTRIQNTPNKQGGFINVGADVAGKSDEAFQGFDDLSTKTLEKLKGKTSVSKQFISDLTNAPDLKQPEREAIRAALADEGDKIDVKKFANKVKSELLPLNVKGEGLEPLSWEKHKELERIAQRTRNPEDWRRAEEYMQSLEAADLGRGDQIVQGSYNKYESITLPDELRGNVKDYKENVYESPIKTSAGNVHGFNTPNYFAHSRIEDMADGKTRRVIEAQSDLFQKGRLDKESGDVFGLMEPNENRAMLAGRLGGEEGISREMLKRKAELSKLEPYRNTWHERIVREEVKQAAQDGKTKLQFPTGETAMKIEGLGQGNTWLGRATDGSFMDVNPQNIQVGATIVRNNGAQDMQTLLSGGQWKVVELLDDGNSIKASPIVNGKIRSDVVEQFDISGSINKENPIYKFYEKEMGKYLKNKYGATRVKDAQGVEWYEINLKPEYGKGPVEAYAATGQIAAQNGDKED